MADKESSLEVIIPLLTKATDLLYDLEEDGPTVDTEAAKQTLANASSEGEAPAPS